MARYSIILALSLYFVSFEASASIDDIDKWWLDREITIQQNREDYARRVYGRSAKSFTEKSGDPNWSLNNPSDPSSGNTKTVTKTVVVEDVPSKSKAGSAGLKRLKAFAGGGVAGVLGGVALDALVEGVGWVMEDGTYVKYKTPETDECRECTRYIYETSYNGTRIANALTPKEACDYLKTNEIFNDHFTDSYPSLVSTSNGVPIYQCNMPMKKGGIYTTVMHTKVNPVYDPNAQPPQTQKITISSEHVGGLLVGDYDDPVDEQYDVKDNIYKGPLADLYQHDSSGVGNELAKEMDQKLQNAQPTSDGNPAPIGDPRYSDPPAEDADTNDRSWTSDSDQVDGESQPIIDPETGEPTGGQSIKLQFPVFCEWAFVVCDWYDDWKISDKKLHEHLDQTQQHQQQTQQHQQEQKSFWQKVEDFFDWTKNDETTNDTQIDIDEQEQQQIDTAVDFGGQCPAPITSQLSFHGSPIEWGITDFTPLCNVMTSYIRPVVIAISGFIAVLIIGGVRTDG